MSNLDELVRILRAKKEIEEAIEDKGVEVPDSDRLDDYDLYVHRIAGAGGSIVWGIIDGDISNHADLAAILATKYEKPENGIP